MPGRRRCCCNSPYGFCLACSPCQIPKKDLTATVSGTTGTLVYFPSGTYCGLSIAGPVWDGKVGPFPIGGGVNVFLQFACIGGTYQLAAQLGSATPSIICGGCAGDPAGGVVFKDFTCNPFHLHWQIPGCAAGIYSSLLDVYIDDPGPLTPCNCFTKICVNGCTSPAGLSGASVTVKSGSTTIATGSTDSTGCVTLDVNTGGTYTVLITKTGFADFSTSQNITCGDSHTYTLTLADGYFCYCGCPNPLPLTGTLNDGFGDITCTWGSSGYVGCAMRPATWKYTTNDCDPDAIVDGTTDVPVSYFVSCTELGGWQVLASTTGCSWFPTLARPNVFRAGDSCSTPGGDFLYNVAAASVGTFSCDPLSVSIPVLFVPPGSSLDHPNGYDIWGAGGAWTFTV